MKKAITAVGNTVLHQAAETSQDPAIIEFLLETGVFSNSYLKMKNDFDQTILDLAKENRDLEGTKGYPELMRRI